MAEKLNDLRPVTSCGSCAILFPVDESEESHPDLQGNLALKKACLYSPVLEVLA